MNALGSLICLLVLATVQIASALSAVGQRVVVLVEPRDQESLQSSHSLFWKSLTDRGLQLNFKSFYDTDLVDFNELQYEHAVVFTPEAKRSDKMSVEKVVDFVNHGGNLMLVGSPGSRSAIRDIAKEFGFIMADPDVFTADDFQFDSKLDSGDHTTIKSSQLVRYDSLFSTFDGSPVLFKGVGHSLDSSNPLLFPLITAEQSAVQKKPGKGIDTRTKLHGSGINLISASQARNNARILFCGSADFFSDRFQKSNGKVVQELSQWLLQESNVLRVKRVQHHRRGETEPREAYRIKDEFVYTIAIEQHQPSGKWEPFKLPSGDVLQLEITMLDPHIRVNLVKGAVPGEYTTPSNLTLADVYGVFTFKVDYKRRGLSYITEKAVVPIHPFRHNEYPRFITAAYPYYAGSFSVIVAFWIFSVLFLFYRDPKKVKTQ